METSSFKWRNDEGKGPSAVTVLKRECGEEELGYECKKEPWLISSSHAKWDLKPKLSLSSCGTPLFQGKRERACWVLG